MKRFSNSVIALSASLTVASLYPSVAEAGPCGTGSAAGHTTCASRPHPGLDVTKFANMLANSLYAIGLKGYSLTMYGEDGHAEPVLLMQMGWGQNPESPTFKFDGTVVSAQASVSKLITEAAVRRAIEVNQESPAFANAPPTITNRRIGPNTKIFDVLPPVFARSASYFNSSGQVVTRFADATIDQVLKHTAGLPRNTTSIWDITKNLTPTCPPNTTCTCTAGTACYANENYQIASIILPLILDNDRSVRATVDNFIESNCSSQPPGDPLDQCELRFAQMLLGSMGMATAKTMVNEPVTTKSYCGPTAALNAGEKVARAYAGANGTNGIYMTGVLDHDCGVGNWYMTSANAANVLRRVWDGMFFNHRATTIPFFHGGDLYVKNGTSSWEYHSIAQNSHETSRLATVILTNSPNSSGQLFQAFRDAMSNSRVAPPTPPTSVPVMTAAKGPWKCTQTGTTKWFSLRIPNKHFTRAFDPQGYGGTQSEEPWFVASETTTNASGTFVNYRIGKGSVRATGNPTGTWTLARNPSTPNTLTVTRKEGSAAVKNYTCSADPLP